MECVVIGVFIAALLYLLSGTTGKWREQARARIERTSDRVVCPPCPKLIIRAASKERKEYAQACSRVYAEEKAEKAAQRPAKLEAVRTNSKSRQAAAQSRSTKRNGTAAKQRKERLASKKSQRNSCYPNAR